MGRHTKLCVVLTPEERQPLEAWQRTTTLPVGLVKRARIILKRSDGATLSEIGRSVGIRRRFVEKWIKRFLAEGMAGLYDKPGRGRKPLFRSGRGGSSDPAGLPKAPGRRTELIGVG